MASSLMLLSNPYRPDPRVLREARALIEEGHRVNIIAWNRDGGDDDVSEEEGVNVIRLGLKSPFRAPAKVFFGLIRFWLKALRTARGLNFDVVHSHDFDTLPLAMLISRLHRAPLLYDAHEIYSNMIWKDVRLLAHMLRPIEIRLSRCADEIITVNERIAEALSEKRDTPVRLVRNSPDMSVLRGESTTAIRRRYGLKGMVISYLGSLEPGRSVEELATSFSPEQGITVVIAGSGTLQSAVEKAAATNSSVRFLGSIETDEALKITLASDLVPTVLDPSNPNFQISTPIKVLEAMACGRPIIISKGLDMSKIVEDAGCGFIIDYDRQQLVDTVISASKSPEGLDQMGRRGTEYYEKHLSWQKSKDALLRAYEALAGLN
ncbi:MAG: glycosyltransferase family 4 protein [Methanobacteriota archaeon]|nr:MAG: glycosyltransferase family 4 protein [Euryarchaeota archaeon]